MSLRECRVVAVVEGTEFSAVSAAVEIATALARDGARVLFVEEQEQERSGSSESRRRG